LKTSNTKIPTTETDGKLGRKMRRTQNCSKVKPSIRNI